MDGDELITAPAGARRVAAYVRLRALAWAWVLAIGCLGAASVAPAPALARWNHVLSARSGTAPYFVCPRRRPSSSRCALIEDPTAGTSIRGPRAAGAITKGPEQEVSPALAGTGVEGGYSPSDLQSAYRMPSAVAGAGQTVAVVDAYDDPSAEADLAVYRAKYGLGECKAQNGCFRKTNQSGGGTLPSPDSTWAREISLDLDMVSAICPNCRILLVEANNPEPASLAAAENEAVAMSATEISDSYEEEESSKHLAAAYEHPGIPIAAAGGDRGYGVVWPASSPHVIAVGGTTLVPEGDRRGWSETVWRSESRSEATGSGCSGQPKPAWQTDSGCAHRTTNDVAAVADLNTPVSAYDSYETPHPWLLLGGTSVSAPIVAGAMALSNSYTRSFDGAQALYLEAANGGGFNDVISGFDGHCTPTYLCEARVGYDGPSGLGTLSGAPEARPPSPSTDGVGPVTQTQALLLGTVNPHAVQVLTCGFRYGTTFPYASYQPCSALPPAGTSPVSVSASASGLMPSTLYHFRLVLTYADGSAEGADFTFVTPGPAPSVYASEPSGVTKSSASLNALVNPGGSLVTGCSFEYGPTPAYGVSAPCSSMPGEGSAPVLVSATVAGLEAGRTYHYRLVAANAGGTAYGGDETVTLLPPSPTVLTRAPSSIGPTSAVLNATVNANGGALTRCVFEFDSAETLIPCASIPGAGAGSVSVWATVTGLRPGHAFRYRIVAANAGGTAYGAVTEFSSLARSSSEAGARLVSSVLVGSSSGALRVRIRCPAHRVRCRGTIALRSDPVAAGTPAARARMLASGAFSVAPGSVATVRLQLTGYARAALSREKVLHARVTVRTSGPGGRVSTWHGTVTVRSA